MVVEILELENATLRCDGALIHSGEQPCRARYSRVTTTTTVRTTAPERSAPASDFGGEPKRRTRTAQQGCHPEFQSQMEYRPCGNARGCREVGAQKRRRGVGPIATSERAMESRRTYYDTNEPAGKKRRQHWRRIEARSGLLGS